MLLSLAVVLYLFGAVIRAVNLRYLRRHAHEVPSGFENAIDAATLGKMSAYTADTGWLSLITSLIIQMLIIVAIFGGLLEDYDRWINRCAHSFVSQGVLYFLILSWIFAIVSIPFESYSNFAIEKRHGFNRITPRLYWSDFAKGLLLTSIFIAILTLCGLSLVKWSNQAWWVLVWAVILLFELTITLIAPKLIEPLFMKITPLKNEQLKADICRLTERAHLRVDQIFQVDASRRSGHTNAYFTGFGPVKRVVLFDTLLEKLEHTEILAVLAHELGHWKRHHIMKSLVLIQGLSLGACYGAYRLINWEGLPNIIGARIASFPMRVSIAMFIGSLIAVFLTPCLNAWSRRHEWQADEYACGLVEPSELASGLIKLARDNLANLHPHPLYARYYGSHPTVVARVARLRAAMGEQSSPAQPTAF